MSTQFGMGNPYAYQPQQYIPGMSPMGGYGMGMPQVGYGAQPNGQVVLNNFLTPEQISELQQFPQQFPTKLTKDEFLRSICLHKANGRITLEKLNDGQHHCTICAKDFFLFDLTTPDETIYGICKNMHDLLQSIKTYLLNAPEALKDIYMMLGFIEKLPLLWKSAVKTFEQASNATAFGLQQGYQQDSFQMLGAMFGGMGGGMGMGVGYYPPQTPPMAYYQQPGVGGGYTPQPPMPPQGVAPTGVAVPGQPPVYGPSGYQQPQYPMTPPAAPAVPPVMYSAPTGYPAAPTMPGTNPVGYVEGNQPGSVAPTQVSISPMQPGQQIPLPEPPVNPNIQPVEKADVNKTFASAS